MTNAKRTVIIIVAGAILMTSCLLLKNNNKCQNGNSNKNMCKYEKVMSIIDTLREEMNFDNHIFEEADFHVFDNYTHRYLELKTVSDSTAFGWFSGKRNDTIYNIILVLTRDKMIYNVRKKDSFFDSHGRFFYMGGVRINYYPSWGQGIPDSIRVYMDSISPVCADDLDEKFEVDDFPILKTDSITIKFH